VRFLVHEKFPKIRGQKMTKKCSIVSLGNLAIGNEDRVVFSRKKSTYIKQYTELLCGFRVVLCYHQFTSVPFKSTDLNPKSRDPKI
jgi:hypothetical protein